MPDSAGVAFLESLHHTLYKGRFGDRFDTVRTGQWDHLGSYRMIEGEEARQTGSNGVAYSPWGLSYYPGGMLPAARALISAGHYSKYEDPTTLLILDRVWNDLRVFYDLLAEAMSETEEGGPSKQRLGNMVVGTFEHRSFNALAVRPQDTDHYLVLLHQGLFKFLSRMARICVYLSASTPVEEYEEIDWKSAECIAQYRSLLEKTISRSEDTAIVESASSAILEYFGSLDLGAFEYQKIDGDHKIMSEIMSQGAETFVLAHECAHAFLGHLEHGSTGVLAKNALASPVKSYNPLQEQENEADAHAMSALLSTGMFNSERCESEEQSSFFYSYFTLGAHLFFESAKTIEQFSQAFLGHDTPPSSHPPLDDRIEAANDICRRISKGHQLRGVSKLAAEFEVIRAATFRHIRQNAAPATLQGIRDAENNGE